MRKIWFTLADACEYLNLKERTVRNLLRTGKLKYTRPSKKIAIHRKWLDGYQMNFGAKLTPGQRRELENLNYSHDNQRDSEYLNKSNRDGGE